MQDNKQSFKALKPKACKSINSIKALSLSIKDKLRDHSSTNDKFYYKVCWRLSEAQIWSIVERATLADDRLRYFCFAAAAEMREMESEKTQTVY